MGVVKRHYSSRILKFAEQLSVFEDDIADRRTEYTHEKAQKYREDALYHEKIFKSTLTRIHIVSVQSPSTYRKMKCEISKTRQSLRTNR